MLILKKIKARFILKELYFLYKYGKGSLDVNHILDNVKSKKIKIIIHEIIKRKLLLKDELYSFLIQNIDITLNIVVAEVESKILDERSILIEKEFLKKNQKMISQKPELLIFYLKIYLILKKSKCFDESLYIFVLEKINQLEKIKVNEEYRVLYSWVYKHIRTFGKSDKLYILFIEKLDSKIPLHYFYHENTKIDDTSMLLLGKFGLKKITWMNSYNYEFLMVLLKKFFLNQENVLLKQIVFWAIEESKDISPFLIPKLFYINEKDISEDKSSLVQLLELKGYENFKKKYNFLNKGFSHNYYVPEEVVKLYIDSKNPIKKLIKTKNRALIRVFLEKFVYNDNWNFYNIGDFISRISISEDNKVNILRGLSSDCEFNFSKRTLDTLFLIIEDLSKEYGDKRIIKLLINLINKEKECEFYNNHNLMDIRYMLMNIPDEISLKEVVGKKPKTLREIHDKLMMFYTLRKQKNFKLRQDFLLDLENFSNDEFNIIVPLRNIDLIKMGIKMNICVGNGSYSNKILDHKSFIFFIEYKKSMYCVELDFMFRIKQVSGAFNKKPPEDVIEYIKKLNFSKYVIYIE